MQQGTRVLERPAGRLRTPSVTAWLVLALVVVAAIVATIGLLAVSKPGSSAAATAVRARVPAAPATIVSGSASVVSADEASALLTTAPSAVVADAASQSSVVTAAGIARRAHAPLLLLPAAGPGPQSAQARAALAAQVTVLRDAIRALHPTAVLGVGVTRASLAADLPHIRLVSKASALPVTTAAAREPGVAVLMDVARFAPGSPVAIAVTTTAAAAGVRVIDVSGTDPRTDPAAIRALAAARPQHVVGIGAVLGPAQQLAARVSVAETGVQLPGGGQILFPGRRIVALYGAPNAPALGVLGRQDLAASIARAKAVAAQYDSLSRVPVIPSFEIIATVAQAAAGRSGTYSSAASVASLRPWVLAASRAGFYVTLDLQPGRASLLTQAEKYRSLLRLPNVGLALDPEWKLKPGQLPMHQIGSVNISEVNQVAAWLAALTARYRLPQKLFELHEFRLSMIVGLNRLDTRHDDLAIVINMDGQGAPRTKLATWLSVIANAPRGVFFGWKDFYVKDTPMLDPRLTMRHRPAPVLISYQ